jgi:hypothetical protein
MMKMSAKSLKSSQNLPESEERKNLASIHHPLKQSVVVRTVRTRGATFFRGANGFL